MSQNGAAAASGYRGWLLAVGVVLSLVSAGYLVLYVHRHWSELPPLRLSWTDGAWLLAAGVLYFTSLLTTAGAWLYALRGLGSDMAPRPALGVALASQIGKYAPGNIAHHIGRAALAGTRGLPVVTTAKASLMEIAVAVAAGGLVALAVGIFAPSARDVIQQVPVDAPRLAALLVVAAAIAVVGALGLRMWLRRARRELPWSRALLASSLKMLGCYALSFVFAGLSYYAVTRAFGQAPDAALCIAVYALAWVVGFITPGAPAGLGVRESILVVATAGALGPAALSIALAHRLVTALADGAGAGAGAWALSSRGKHG